MYDIASGRELAAYSHSKFALNDQAIVTGLSMHLPVAEPKHKAHRASYSHGDVTTGQSQSYASTTRTNLRNVSWDLAGLGE